jgi:hypothetical protein
MTCFAYTASIEELGTMPFNREENKMSILEKNLLKNLKNIKQIAKANTLKNKEGLTIVTKNDPFREEIDWETSVKKYDDKK